MNECCKKDFSGKTERVAKTCETYDEYFMNKKISESLEEANHNYDRLREALKKSLLNFTKTKKPNAYRNFI